MKISTNTHETIQSFNQVIGEINKKISSHLFSKQHNLIKPELITNTGILKVSLEAENGYMLADYYGEQNGGYPFICKELYDWAEKNGFYWEWESPGMIGLYFL